MHSPHGVSNRIKFLGVALAGMVAAGVLLSQVSSAPESGSLAPSGGSEPIEHTAPVTDEQPLPQESITPDVNGRSVLEVCVSVAPTLVALAADATHRVQDALKAAVGDSRSQEYELDRWPRRVHEQCPDGYFSPHPDIARDPGLSQTVNGEVSEPPPISLFVFVTDGKDTDVLGARGIGRQAYQDMCHGVHVCGEVATALFVAPWVVEDPELLKGALLVGLGVDESAAYELYPGGHPPGWEFQPKEKPE